MVSEELIRCPCCDRMVPRIVVEAAIVNFLRKMTPETWVSREVLSIKFLIIDDKRMRYFNKVLEQMADRGLIEISGREKPLKYWRYRFPRPPA